MGQTGVDIPLIAPYGTAVRMNTKDLFLGDRHVPGENTGHFSPSRKLSRCNGINEVVV
ncbi:hypothetical protein BDV32DRAFT_132908 [Aspergillus pseudonomiae]|nr:hypothetical protein BDV32DRAFT_132908 [Aspergillus pseudonomiae]